MKKWVKIFGLMVMWEFVFYGCGGGGGGGEGVNYKLGPKTKWVEKDTNWKLESKEENRLIYTYTGNPPDIKEGDILLSVEGGGYLRKVVDVDVEGGRLIVTTEQASLEEAFEELDIKTTIKLPQSSELSPPGIFQSPPYPVKSPLTIEMGALNIPISYSIPIDYGTMEVEGSFKFTPSIDVEIKISMFKLKKFRLVLRGDVQQGLGVNMGIEKGIEKEYEIPLIDYGGLIAPTPVQLFAVAIGPVLINGKFTLSGGVGVSLDAGIDGEFGYDTSLTMGGGVEYMDGNWNPVTEFDYEFNPYFDYKVYAGLEGEVYLEPRLGIYIYDAAGPYFQLKPYGKGAITFIPNIHLEAGLGLSGSVGGSVKILSWSLIDRNYELFDFYEVLWEKDLTGGAICGNGVCESGETETNCPEDCGGGGAGAICGNGVCESGETETSCPEDCGPVLWLKFDECSGSTAYDSSGKGNNGAINGATWVNLGGGNCVLSFDGVDDYVEIPDSSFFDSSKMTIEAWFNVSSCPSGEPTDIVSKHSDPGDVQMLFRLEADCKLDIEWTIGDKFYDLSYGSCPPSNSYCDDEVGIYNVTLNTWYHGVAVYDGNEIILYVNGQKIKSIEASGEIVKNSLPIIIGGSGLAWSQESFAGEIDEVRIYPTALSGDTILEHYQNEKERYP